MPINIWRSAGNPITKSDPIVFIDQYSLVIAAGLFSLAAAAATMDLSHHRLFAAAMDDVPIESRQIAF